MELWVIFLIIAAVCMVIGIGASARRSVSGGLPPPPRVQFVFSGKFISLLLVSVGLLGSGYYWYNKERLAQERLQPPPYFVNRGAVVVRTCKHCIGLTGLKPQLDWIIGPPTEIPATEEHWFLAAEDPPTPVTVAGVQLLPVYPTLRDNPAFGFDESQMLLVLYQNVQRMLTIEQPQLPPVQPPALPEQAARGQIAEATQEINPALFLGEGKTKTPIPGRLRDFWLPVIRTIQ